jgi:probable O-glycosylation ligase (exosortase A-associated)
MNPHRLAWGFMYDFPVVLITALVTLIGMLNSKETKRMIWSREIIVLLLLIIWMGITTTQAFFPEPAWLQYEKVIKIQILTFMTLLLLTSRQKVHIFVWIIALSLGFYGIKGGIFTILNGGAYRVQGPSGSFIAGNNELALALIMTIPLLRYLYLHEKRRWLKWGLAAAMLLTAIAAIGSQSRGALVGIVVMGAIFWFKSRYKFATTLIVAVAIGAIITIMPPAWYERMATIQNYEQDDSALGRINAWRTAFNVAQDRVTGGGFEMFRWPVFRQYAPEPNRVHDAHSIYFEMLGEHGFPGLALFLTLLGFTWLKCGQIIRAAKKETGLTWARDLAAMIQVSLVSYMASGAFLGLAYFNYVYHLVAIVTVTAYLVAQSQSSHAPEHKHLAIRASGQAS